MASWRAWLHIGWMRLRRNKRFYADRRTMRELLAKHQDPARARPPGWLRRAFAVTTFEIDGHRCYTIAPRGGPVSDRHIFHLHGGGFVESPEGHHWRFAARMVDLFGCRYSLPMYPLAPAHDRRTIVPMAEKAYAAMTESTPAGRRLVFGDSAGGTLALTLARHLREVGAEQPAAIALFSPWIDLATDDPRSRAIDPVDPELGVTGLQQAGSWYAGDRALDDPEVSPAFADLTGSPPLAVFIGGRDILLPDARRIKELGDRAGVSVDIHEYPEMFHNWIMKRIPEATEAIEQLTRFVHRLDEE